MYEIGIHKRIDQIVRLFRVFGWRMEDESTGFRKIEWKLIYLILYICFAITLVSGGLLRDDLIERIFVVSVGISGSVIIVKLTYILWKMKEIRVLTVDIGVHSIADYEEYVKANEKLNKLMKFASTCLLMIFINGAGLLIFRSPIFASKKRLPFDIWFPFDWEHNAIIYWTAYIFVMTGTIVSITVTSLNAIIWYLMMCCSIKYQILGNQFRSVFLKKTTHKKKKITKSQEEKLFLQELIDLIKAHRNIQENVERFKSCFGNLFFAQITTSGLSICGSVYSLTFVAFDEDLLQSVICISFLMHNMFDIFMVMYLANEIMVSSDRLSYCLFESNWLEQSKSCKKNMIILMEVLKQPQVLVIGKIYPLNLETFTSIMKLAYSSFNILKNLN